MFMRWEHVENHFSSKVIKPKNWNGSLNPGLNLCFHIVDGVTGLDIERDSFSGERLHENLHASTQAQDQMQSAFFLNIVVGQCASVLQLLAGEDEALPWQKTQE